MSEFEHALYQTLAALSDGDLISYGQLAKQCGYPNYARQVGKVLSKLPSDTKLPWYRVLNSQRKISLTGDGFERQKQLLITHGFTVNDNGLVQKRHNQ